MGTPNRLNVLFDEARIEFRELSEEDLLQLVRRIISEISPHLKCINPHMFLGSGIQGSYSNNDSERIVESAVIVWPEDASLINSHYKVLLLGTNASSLGPVRKCRNVTKENERELSVFLGRDANIIFAETIFEVTRTPRKRDREFVSRKAVRINIYEADHVDLVKEIMRNERVGRDFIYWLNNNFYDTVRKREKNLSRMKIVRDFLSRLNSRIS